MDDKKRCDWATKTEIEMKYHDTEWGKPLHGDYGLFEFLILETFQAGLSWVTILNKRENFRKAFDNFDFNIIASYDEHKIYELLQDKGIIRNKLKIRAAVSNANAFIEVREQYGSFDSYIWDFVDGKPIVNHWKTHRDVPPNTLLSDKISKDLKKKGFKFVGTTVVYAHMQATGMVNDHLTSCFCHPDYEPS